PPAHHDTTLNPTPMITVRQQEATPPRTLALAPLTPASSRNASATATRSFFLNMYQPPIGNPATSAACPPEARGFASPPHDGFAFVGTSYIAPGPGIVTRPISGSGGAEPGRSRPRRAGASLRRLGSRTGGGA